MIKLRLASFERTHRDREINIQADELLSAAVVRVLAEEKIQEDPKEVFKAVVNGKIINADLWPFTKLSVEDTVLIAPNLQNGDSLRQAIFIGALIAASAFISPAIVAATGLNLGLVNAVVGFVAAYALNQLIPPPVPGTGNISGASNLASSQMYSITSQANAAKKFGRVPKVYGEHRIFPTVAANPYTELEVDPATGKLAQFFYAVYDFGMGTNIVQQIKIGDTPISNFSDVSIRLVDFNKPAVSTGDWDDILQDDLLYYKGDLESDSISAELNGNQEELDPVSEYQIRRNAAANDDNLNQEISVNFVNPAGLYAFNSTGARGERTIDLQIEFSKVGLNDWKQYNDPTYVNSSTALGGDSDTSDKTLTLGAQFDFDPATMDPDSPPFPYAKINSTIPKVKTMRYGLAMQKIERVVIGLTYNRNFVFPNAVADTLVIGDRLKWNGQILGTVASISAFGIQSKIVALNNRAPITIPLWEYDVVRDVYTIDEFVSGTKTVTPINPTAQPVLKAGDILGRLRITASTTEAHYSAIKFTPKENADYEVRITRISTRSNYNTSVADSLTVINLNTRIDRAPINTAKRHTFMEIRIKATGQLNGAIQNLSALCTSVLPVYDSNTQTWAMAPTNNPAWVLADILTGEVNKRAISKDRLHMDSLVEWAEYCDEVPESPSTYTYQERRFQCNFILDFETTVQNLAAQITGAAQASMNIIDGKYGVLLDIERTVPTQIFTPRNSSGFSSSRGYPTRPHGLKVSYIDPNSEWQPNELVVYDDGYTVLNATEFEEIQTFACTQVEQAFRFGRYFMAQNKLRQETMSLKVDFEHLVCTRGDYVQITQDVMKVGGTPARVKEIDGSGDCIIDEAIETLPDEDYGYVCRKKDGRILTNTLTIVDADNFILDGAEADLPEEGDIIIIGVVDQIVYDCIVKAIHPSDDLSAVLTLVEKAAAIYTIESADTIPGYDPKISVTANSEFSAPGEVSNLEVDANSYNVKNAGYEYYVDLDWDSPQGAAYDIFEVYADWGKGYELVGSTKFSEYRYIVNSENLGTSHSFKVLAVSATGNKLGLGEVSAVTATPVRKITPPSNVGRFNSDITGETLQLFWDLVPDLDIKEYVIRFVPELNAVWQDSTTLQRVSASTSLAATQARVGTYLIKAVDLNGNESLEATAIITTIASLNGLNVIQETTDFPTLLGSLSRVEKLFTDTLILQQSSIGTLGNEEFYPEGFYYFKDLLQFDDIYQVRLQSLITAQGYSATDIMSNWASLADVDLMYSPGSSDWDVELQYRGSNVLNVMSEWDLMSDVALLSGGAEDNWTEWRKFIIGDAQARNLQFRLRMLSYKSNVSPRVFEAIVRADMPDRFENYNNLSAPDTGLVVNFTPAFLATPNVQISLENGQAGDYWEFISKTKTGFEIVFYDKLDNAVARQFDAAIKGYGRLATSVL